MVDNLITYHFLKSTLSNGQEPNTIEELLVWLEGIKRNTKHTVEQVDFDELEGWGFEKNTGNLVHDSGKFFSIEGITVDTNWGEVKGWSQPIINQPEVGFLGVITKKINGVLCFLMQAKIEPGNINGVQISPTLQATKSNYNRVHKGDTPLYLEYFIEKRNDVKVLLDQLQSEQGARFLRKRNRNIIIEVEGDVEIKEGFCWMTLRQIKELMRLDNVINMDTRTVISGIPFGNIETLKRLEPERVSGNSVSSLFLDSELDSDKGLNSVETIISWITNHKSFAELDVKQFPLNKVDFWGKNEKSIYHKDKKYFEIIAIKTEIGNREVRSWTQPLVKSAQEGLIAFVIKKINGVYHFLVQAKMEPGNFDIIELAPTVQCLTGNYRKGNNEYEVEYIDVVLNPEAYGGKVHFSTMQSEEGGRFYKEQNKNMIIEVGDDFSEQVSEKYIWMTLNQLKTFIKFNNYVNIQARSLMSAIKYD